MSQVSKWDQINYRKVDYPQNPKRNKETSKITLAID